MKNLIDLFNTCTAITEETLDSNSDSELESILRDCNDVDTVDAILDASTLEVQYI